MFSENDLIDLIARAAILSALAVCWVVFVVRIIGLRAFSKMTAFDFVITVSIGSLLAGASQATTWPEFAQPALAMAALLGVQFVVAHGRQVSDGFDAAIQNSPVLLMREGSIMDEALKKTRVTKGDLMAKLREANVLQLSDVRAVVLETTGDISVLHGAHLSTDLLKGVRKVERSS